MRIDHCLILAAGFGTRMGAIGQKLPKVLWPVFEKSLLELQVAYAKSLGIPKIFVNLHYMGEEIFEAIKGKSIFEDVEFLWEKPEILDIGGGIQNLAAKVNYKGKLLVLNADQFFYIKKDDLFKILEPYKAEACTLFSYFVDPKLGYNALEITPERMMSGIVKNKDLQTTDLIETYTGISFVDLSKLKKISGASPFFESVANFKDIKIPVILLKNVDYWDFGTVKRYWETCFRILSLYKVQSTHPFLRFLVQERALKTWKINLQQDSYNAKSHRTINLAEAELGPEIKQAIVLDGTAKPQASERSMLWWKDLSEEVK
jgi:NDP-sugar pyrophosphorylase family protein